MWSLVTSLLLLFVGFTIPHLCNKTDCTLLIIAFVFAGFDVLSRCNKLFVSGYGSSIRAATLVDEVVVKGLGGALTSVQLCATLSE